MFCPWHRQQPHQSVEWWMEWQLNQCMWVPISVPILWLSNYYTICQRPKWCDWLPHLVWWPMQTFATERRHQQFFRLHQPACHPNSLVSAKWKDNFVPVSSSNTVIMFYLVCFDGFVHTITNHIYNGHGIAEMHNTFWHEWTKRFANFIGIATISYGCVTEYIHLFVSLSFPPIFYFTSDLIQFPRIGHDENRLMHGTTIRNDFGSRMGKRLNEKKILNFPENQFENKKNYCLCNDIVTRSSFSVRICVCARVCALIVSAAMETFHIYGSISIIIFIVLVL